MSGLEPGSPTGELGDWFGTYFKTVGAILDRVRAEQSAAVGEAATRIAASLADGGLVHVFGCGHSHLFAEDIFYRAGGLCAVDPILPPTVLLQEATSSTWFERQEGYIAEELGRYDLRSGEVVIIVSSSGRNPDPIDVALYAQSQGLSVVAIASRQFAAAVTSRHSSGKNLVDLADIVIDNYAEPGDAAVAIPGVAERIGPTSSAIGMAIIQGIVVETVAELTRRGVKPELWMSANLPDGDGHNAASIERFRRRVRHL